MTDKGDKEDPSMLYFQDVYDSPDESDTSSVDIYDGLDISSIPFSAEPSVLSTPTRDCLDLYEEILTEEVTAKEASFNDLHAEYEKCQKQMKELVNRLKEMQTQNTTLQNENQCLKKNISALIKTARVEINRKEDEINRLNQRLFSSVNPRINKHITVPLSEPNKTSCQVESRSREIQSKITDSCGKPELQNQTIRPKRNDSTLLNYQPTEQGTNAGDKNSSSSSKPSCAKLFKGSETDLQKDKSKELSNQDAGKGRKERNVDDQSKERRQMKEECRSSSTNSAIERKTVEQRETGLSSNSVKNEKRQENPGTKFDSLNEKNNRKSLHMTSHDKARSMREGAQSREDPRTKEKLQKSYESYSRRDSKDYVKGKDSEHRNRITEKDDPPRRSQRTSYLKEESYYKLKTELNDHRRSSDPSRRERHSSDFNKDSKSGYRDSKLISSSKNEQKVSKKEDKSLLERKSIKSGRDKKDERKGSREKEGSHHDRKEHKEFAGEGKLKDLSSNIHSSEVKSSCKTDNPCKHLNAEKQVVDEKDTKIVRDLKLSYMENLNLTLSPAKTKSPSESKTNELPLVLCDEKWGIGEITALEPVPSSESINEVKSVSSPKSNPEPIILTDQPSVKLVTKSNLNLEEFQKSQSKHVVGGITVEESNTAPVNITLAVADHENADLNDALHSLHSDEMETTSFADRSQIIDLDSYIELDKCSGSESPHSDIVAEDRVAQIEFSQENRSPSELLNKEFEHNTNILKNVTEPEKGICEPSNSDPVEISTKEIDFKQSLRDDDDSVLNIDLHFIRRVPKIISPLKSPMKPIVKLHKIDYTAKASVVRMLNKEFCYSNGSSSAHLSKELNKENFQPVVKNDPSSAKCSPIIISSDDMEEGEIVSDVEEVTCVQAPNTALNPKQGSVVQTNISEDSISFQRDDGSLGKPNGIIASQKQSIKSKGKSKSNLLKQPNKKERKVNPDNCLEEILKTDQPSSVQDILQMLRAVRKHIRKKYMKFKMQFTVRQYHKVIEVGTSYFIMLVKKVNWTALCSLPSSLQKKLCKYIDNKMKKLKKNGIVDRIFEQHLLDMKKKLWNFVDDQLDSLFDTLKIMLTKLCDKVELECTSDKNRICDNLSSSVQINKKNEQENHKTASVSDPHLKKGPVEIQYNAQVSKIKDQNNKPGRNSLNKDGLSKEPVKGSVGVESTSKSKMLLEKKLKPALSGSPENQNLKPDNSGLSFNLVSDDHMGDIFKNLLNDLEGLDQTKTSEEKSWVFKTPEKTSILSPKMSFNENTPIKTSFQLLSSLSWPPHSPVQSSSFSTLEMVVNPDALDESCMLEIPLSSSSGKSIPGSDERAKSYSSILMEDLAVSLTLPSPLKSDSHLSFLRLGTAPEYNSEEVIRTHYSESALLEEDVAEQDIHLTLDSDNSNSSLENTSHTSSFQCLPSEPMQAVIMEKSNDHFIVKIRRAASTSSPNSEWSPAERFPPVLPESTNADVKALTDHLKKVNFEEHQSEENNTHETENKVFQINKCDATRQSVSKAILESSFVNANNEAVDFKQLQGKDMQHERTVSLFKPPEPLSPSKDNTVVSVTPENLHQLFHSVTDKKDCEKSKLSSEQVTKDSILCNKGSSESIVQANCNDNVHRTKRKMELKAEPLAKRRPVQCLNQESKEKKAKEDGKEQSNISQKEKSQRKHKRSASDCILHLSSSPNDSSQSISAKNVIKKKGEIVTTWSRDEDRLILLNCQQLGADQKTFMSLSSKMDKHPHEIEGRFRQLMKLFKKCRYSST